MSNHLLQRVTLGLGVLSALAILVAHLALTDIYHGEADVSSEWRALQVASGVIIAFHIAAFAMLIRHLGSSSPR